MNYKPQLETFISSITSDVVLTDDGGEQIAYTFTGDGYNEENIATAYDADAELVEDYINYLDEQLQLAYEVLNKKFAISDIVDGRASALNRDKELENVLNDTPEHVAVSSATKFPVTTTGDKKETQFFSNKDADAFYNGAEFDEEVQAYENWWKGRHYNSNSYAKTTYTPKRKDTVIESEDFHAYVHEETLDLSCCHSENIDDGFNQVFEADKPTIYGSWRTANKDHDTKKKLDIAINTTAKAKNTARDRDLTQAELELFLGEMTDDEFHDYVNGKSLDQLTQAEMDLMDDEEIDKAIELFEQNSAPKSKEFSPKAKGCLANLFREDEDMLLDGNGRRVAIL